MSADAIRDSIVSTLAGFGYAVSPNTEPSVKSWDTLPVVRVCPLAKPKVTFMAMDGFPLGSYAHRNVKQAYQIVYVADNKLNPTPPDPIWLFKQNLINAFMGANPALAVIPGVWQSRVEDDTDFRRDLLPKGYNYSSMRVVVDYIQNQ